MVLTSYDAIKRSYRMLKNGEIGGQTEPIFKIDTT